MTYQLKQLPLNALFRVLYLCNVILSVVSMAFGTERLKHKRVQKHLTEQIDKSLYDYICVVVMRGPFLPYEGSPAPYSL